MSLAESGRKIILKGMKAGCEGKGGGGWMGWNVKSNDPPPYAKMNTLLNRIIILKKEKSFLLVSWFVACVPSSFFLSYHSTFNCGRNNKTRVRDKRERERGIV